MSSSLSKARLFVRCRSVVGNSNNGCCGFVRKRAASSSSACCSDLPISSLTVAAAPSSSRRLSPKQKPQQVHHRSKFHFSSSSLAQKHYSENTSSEYRYPLNEHGDVELHPPEPSTTVARFESHNDNMIEAAAAEQQQWEEVIRFPVKDPDDPDYNTLETPVLLNAKEHVVGYLSRILNARVYDAAIETELQPAKNLSTHLKNTVYLKREDQQPVFSFKIRGAYNKMAHLTKDELAKGVVCCSAGNHAQGVALSSRMLGCRAVIVMPLATPSIKVNAVRVHGGPTVEVRLFGNNYDEAAQEARRLQAEDGMTFVHPFDDPLVIAGQGTIGMEILKSMVTRPLDFIFVCCGGGGLLAGIAAYVKRVRPTVKVIGVEAADAAGMTASIREGKIVTLPSVGLFADGAAVRTVGKETFRVCNTLVDDMITVDTDQICSAIKLAYNDARVVLEPAGALAVAGMKKYVEENEITGQSLVAIASGANMDFDRLRFVSERADSSERTLAVTIPERPGSFRALYSLIWPRNVTEFSYRYESEGDAHVLLSFQPVMNIENDFEGIMNSLRENGFSCLDLSHNELAKVHVRHLAGGRSHVTNERLFRFEFPESPGALQRFLLSLDMDWNVSLFHYRNHGDDFGRVLVGIQVSSDQSEDKKLTSFLKKLGYRYVDETNNLVYRMYLRPTATESNNLFPPLNK